MTMVRFIDSLSEWQKRLAIRYDTYTEAATLAAQLTQMQEDESVAFSVELNDGKPPVRLTLSPDLQIAVLKQAGTEKANQAAMQIADALQQISNVAMEALEFVTTQAARVEQPVPHQTATAPTQAVRTPTPVVAEIPERPPVSAEITPSPHSRVRRVANP
jgi:hypothetical protein